MKLSQLKNEIKSLQECSCQDCHDEADRLERILKKGLRSCKWCGRQEHLHPVGGYTYTNIAPHLGYCMDCINRAFTKETR